MNAIEFHQWVLNTKAQLQSSNFAPDRLLSQVIKRLQSSEAILDSSVLEAFGVAATYDGQHNANHPTSLKFGQDCIGLLPQDKLLAAQLRLRMADLLASQGAIDKALSLRTIAHQDLLSQENFLIQLRIENQVKAGQEALRLGDKATAELHFLDVMSFNWTNIEEPKAFHFLREQYLMAGEGLIICRAGDARALRNIFFIPATAEILQPILDKAISSAER